MPVVGVAVTMTEPSMTSSSSPPPSSMVKAKGVTLPSTPAAYCGTPSMRAPMGSIDVVSRREKRRPPSGMDEAAAALGDATTRAM